VEMVRYKGVETSRLGEVVCGVSRGEMVLVT